VSYEVKDLNVEFHVSDVVVDNVYKGGVETLRPYIDQALNKMVDTIRTTPGAYKVHSERDHRRGGLVIHIQMKVMCD